MLGDHNERMDMGNAVKFRGGMLVRFAGEKEWRLILRCE